jgi:Ca2+-binding EF-hand superfamily protein
MGTVHSAQGHPLVTPAVIHYITLSREQVLGIRDACLYMVEEDGFIKRQYFHMALSKMEIPVDPDGDILDCLFTMLDRRGDDMVDLKQYIVSISALACPEGLEMALHFAMEVMDVEHSDRVTNEDVTFVLRCKCVLLCLMYCTHSALCCQSVLVRLFQSLCICRPCG